MKKIVIASLSRAGLCNRLFIWAEALIFAEKYSFPLYVNGWYKTPVGPWLRNERIKRFYFFYFKNQSNLFKEIIRKLFFSRSCSYNPNILDIAQDYNTFIFNKMPMPADYFRKLSNHRAFIKDSLIKMLSKKTFEKIKQFSNEDKIGVHVRLGDFTTLGIYKEQQYFIRTINFVRSKLRYNLPVTIFTDGYKNQVSDILELENTAISKNDSDIVDLIHLSNYKVIITSPTSTFSYWAAFLSDAIIIHPGTYQFQQITMHTIKTLDDWKVEM